MHTEAEQGSFPGDNTIADNITSHSGVLKLLSLNVAHGRKEAVNQIFVSKQQIQKNLSDIAHAIVRQGADVVALQEADGPSRWSGSFDHVEFIAKQASYPWYYRAVNAHSWMFNYGTAILSRWPVSETLAYNFKPSPPTVNKGFLLTRMTWKPDPAIDKEINIDIVSVHLDFSSQKVRENQIAEMREQLSSRNNPLIILGDFNSNWFSKKSVIKRLAENGKLQAYKPLADNLATYPGSGRRLDWILISSELEFISYKVLPDRLSDHFMVVAEIQLRKE
ncbi:MAG: hypothetical protein GQ529_01210 [Methyloprofundus sp.]|nr:hypothetical protein [Methyloprofundus sp.]